MPTRQQQNNPTTTPKTKTTTMIFNRRNESCNTMTTTNTTSSNFFLKMMLWIFASMILTAKTSSAFLQQTQLSTQHNRYHNTRQLLDMSSIDDDEQATAAIRSLVDFHEGKWKGTSNSFSVTPDVAAGIVQRKLSSSTTSSSEYFVSVKLSMMTTTDGDGDGDGDPQRQRQQPPKIALSETISWDDNEKVVIRLLPLQDCDFDIDSVDGSYSLDTTTITTTSSGATQNNKNTLPTVLSGTDKVCEFLIEHCIATGENRRMRCFALYGTDEALIRVVISNEERVVVTKGDDDNSVGMNGSTSSFDDDMTQSNDNGKAFTAKDLLEMQNDVDRLVDKIVSQMDNSNGDENGTSTRSSSSIEDDTSSSDTNGSSSFMKDEDDFSSRLGRLGDSVSSSEGTQELELHDVSLLEISSGVWLGDAIIRDTPDAAASPMERNKGFGKTPSVEVPSWKSKVSRALGGWTVGVQKIAFRWMWNFGEEIRQVVDVGKALGSPIENSITKSLAGNVCLDESLSRRIPKDERMVYIDWSQQDAVGFLLGPCSVQVPRYINFDPSAATTSRTFNKPFYTEFSVFQEAPLATLKDGTTVEDDNSKKVMSNVASDGMNFNEDNLPELVCSKIGRLYNFEGRLKQGISSFYTFQRFGVDETDE